MTIAACWRPASPAKRAVSAAFVAAACGARVRGGSRKRKGPHTPLRTARRSAPDGSAPPAHTTSGVEAHRPYTRVGHIGPCDPHQNLLTRALAARPHQVVEELLPRPAAAPHRLDLRRRRIAPYPLNLAHRRRSLVRSPRSVARVSGVPMRLERCGHRRSR
eukprot:2717144-Prymnesium_polylepis.1